MTGLAIADRPTLAMAVHAVHEESGGLVHVAILLPEDAPALIGGIIAGEPDALFMGRMASDLLQGVVRGVAAGKPLLCTSCPEPLAPGAYALAVILPARDSPSHGIGLGVCRSCATTATEVRAKAMEAVQRLWPDSRPVDIPAGPVGHA